MGDEHLRPSDPTEADLNVARSVAQAVLALEGVHSLGAGRYAEAATYGPGEKVMGVVVWPEEVQVHVVARYPEGTPLRDLMERVGRAAEDLAQGRSVSVVIEDIHVSGPRDESI